MPRQIELRTHQDLSEIGPAEWEALLRPDDNPFLSFAFLQGLEETGCVAPERGWWPCHLTAWCKDEEEGAAHGNQRLLAAAPAYVKNDGMGDFSRDWGLQDIAQRLAAPLYPKLVVGVPFSPVTGRRILVRDGEDAPAFAELLMALAREVMQENRLASIQVLYHHPEEEPAFEQAGLAPRMMVQYHWRNHGYGTAEDWLGRLPGKKRNQARRERTEPARQGIGIRTVRGEELAERPRHWADLAYELYATTCQKYLWGGAYLNRAFYRLLFERLSTAVELVIAERGADPIAGAINLATATHLFGRYWGCHEEHRFLHFNVCLYHSIEECIARGIQVFEGGAGGEHKLSRGFEPVAVHCAQSFAHRELDALLGRALRADARSRQRQLADWRAERGLLT